MSLDIIIYFYIHIYEESERFTREYIYPFGGIFVVFIFIWVFSFL